jgi:hypothetical protein
LDLALQELDVVDQQDIDIAVAALEGGRAVISYRVDEVVGELLAGDVSHLRAGEQASDVVTNRVQQVGFAEPRVAVDKQRVVCAAGRLGHRNGCCVCEAIGRADDEGFEDVFGVEARLGGATFGTDRCRGADTAGSGPYVDFRVTG